MTTAGFGFEVGHNGDRWAVLLPHQCGDWEIYWGKSCDEAVAALTAFIKEGQDAPDWLLAARKLVP